MGTIGRYFDPGPLSDYLLSRILDKIKGGEPLTPEDIEGLSKPPKDLICETRVPAEPPEPPIDPGKPKPPSGRWARIGYAIVQALRILRVLGQ
jgi:hypothetical protein